MSRSLFGSSEALLFSAEILGEMGEPHHGVGGEPAQRAKRSELHGVAEIFEDYQIGGAVLALGNLVHQLDAAGRADAARRALAAGFDGAELHGEARLPGHVDRVVEHHDAAMPDQSVAGGERLVIERRIE